MVQTLGLAPAIINRAQKSAVLRAARRFEQALEDRVATELDIHKPALKRFRVKSKRVNTAGVVWAGYNPIKAGYVAGASSSSWGRLKQEDWGASARSYLFPGGFLAKMKSGHRGIFERTGLERPKLAEQFVRVDKAPSIASALMPQTAAWYQADLAQQIAQRLAKAAGGQVAK